MFINYDNLHQLIFPKALLFIVMIFPLYKRLLYYLSYHHSLCSYYLSSNAISCWRSSARSWRKLFEKPLVLLQANPFTGLVPSVQGFARHVLDKMLHQRLPDQG
jgi:hypothetical protein